MSNTDAASAAAPVGDAAYELYGFQPNDVVLSPNGQMAYATLENGNVVAFDLLSRTQVATWDVGRHLGALDVTTNGNTLWMVEKQELSQTGDQWDTRTKIATYSLDLNSGVSTRHTFLATGYDGPFHDIATTDDGKVLLTQDFYGSGWTPVYQYNPKTDHYVAMDGFFSQSGTLTGSRDHSFTLEAPSNISDAPLYMFESGAGFVASHDGYDDDVSGFNWGVQAISEEADLVVQGLGSTLHVYNLGLNYQLELNSTDYGGEAVEGLAFDLAGEHLYLLDTTGDQVIEVSTSTWALGRTFALGADLSEWEGGDYGNRLLMSADGRWMTVVGGGLQLIDLAYEDGVYRGSLRADRMGGGGGDDRYYVNHARDVIYEFAGEGSDKVISTVSYRLGAELEQLILDGGDAIDGRGNALDNLLRGNDAANRLLGGAGADRLAGAGGDDVIVGGLGGDTMSGDEGADRFVFGRSDFRGLVGTDRILGFSQGEGDLIDLSAVDAVRGGGDDAFAFIGSAAFSGAAGELRFQPTGAGEARVEADITGDGVADFAFRVAGDASLTADDFVL